MHLASNRFLILFCGLWFSLFRPATAFAGALSTTAPSPQVDWQLGVIALVAIGIAGAGVLLAANARRRRDTRAVEQESRQGAARARSAITGGDRGDDPGDLALERDQKTPGTSLQRTRSQ